MLRFAALALAAGQLLAQGEAELANVRRIRERIVARQEKTAPRTYQVTIPNTTVTYEMVPVVGGEFQMGPEPQRHAVRVGPFWIQAHEVTWDEYRLFMFAVQAGEKPGQDPAVDAVSRPTRPYVEMSFGMGLNGYPAISMTQHAANKYAEWLSARTGQFYRLPTEAEWEYACRAGGAADPSPLGDYAWFKANSAEKYQLVGSKKPNAWGIYDMLGNVMEWTLDQYAPYSNAPASDPWVRPKQPYPIAVRGGSWNDPAPGVSCTVRVGSDASWKEQDPQLPKSIWYETDAQWLGFRLVRPAKVPSAEEMSRYWNNGVERDEQAAVIPRLFESVEPHMGTLFRIQLYAADALKANQAFRAAFDRIAQLDRILSDYNPRSELNCIRSAAVSPDLFTVLQASRRLAEASDGAFDITVGPLTRLWRQARKDHLAPSAEAIALARSHCGYGKLHVDPVRRTVTLDDPEMLLDVGGIAKGYAADEALAAISRVGIASALVAASGDLAFSDAPPGQPGWKIAVEASDRVRILKNGAVSTSGDAEQHLDVGGRRYSHIIDPATGVGLTQRIEVSVIGRHGIDTDGASTAVSVLGPEKGLAFIDRQTNLSASIRFEEHGRWRIVESARK